MLYTISVEYPKICFQILFTFILLLIVELSKAPASKIVENFNEALLTNDYQKIKKA